MSEAMNALRARCEGCMRCELGKTRTKLVFGVGQVPSPIVFVGEGPGAQEDLQGEPFVGAAGKLLDKYLGAVGIDRDSVYIANILKCRPPANRDPLPAEQDACIGFLREQVQLIRPKVIVCLGRIAAMRLIRPDFRITREHGQWFERDGVFYMAMYHPAALLRDAAKRPEAFADLMSLRDKARFLRCY